MLRVLGMFHKGLGQGNLGQFTRCLGLPGSLLHQLGKFTPYVKNARDCNLQVSFAELLL